MGKATYFLKNHSARLLYAAGTVDRKIREISPDSFIVLMYQRVLPAGMVDDIIQPGMYVLPETLEQHLLFLAARFDICAIEEIGKPRAGRKRPGCLITFDDGWHDFHEYAFPVLQKYRVPVTVFLPTGFVGTDKMFWTDRLAIFLKNAPAETGRSKSGCQEDPDLEVVRNFRGKLSRRIELSIEYLKQKDRETIERVLKGLSESTSGNERNRRVFMTWDQVRALRKTGLISFGSHTDQHRILTNLGNMAIEKELLASRQRLVREQAVDPGFIPFCYPNGNYSDGIKAMVQKAGYSSAFTTRPGVNGPHPDWFALKRFGMHQDMGAHVGLLGCRLAGLL